MTAAFRRGADVAVVASDADDLLRTYVARVPDGPLLVLEGPAHVIWEEALSGDEVDLVDRVAARLEVATEDVADAVETYLAELQSRGLLERTR